MSIILKINLNTPSKINLSIALDVNLIPVCAVQEILVISIKVKLVKYILLFITFCGRVFDVLLLFPENS